MESSHSLKVSDLKICVFGDKLIQDFGYTFHPGKHYVIVGPSGVGKTSLLECIGFLRHPEQGSIEYAFGSYIALNNTKKYVNRRSYWNKHLSFQFQDGGIIPGESVLFNVTLSTFSKYKKSAKQRVQRIFEDINLDSHLSMSASRLSGGEKRRLALARALYYQKNIYLFDEPTASLDEGNRRIVAARIRSLVNMDKIVISATHDVTLVESADCVIEL